MAVALPTTNGASLWDPLPVTLPTYVGKTVAKRTVRNIAVGEPGTWSSGHATVGGSSAVGSEPLTSGEAARQADADETHEAAESQRAANG